MDIQTVRCVLPFEWISPSFIAYLQRPFKPVGLALWGAHLAQASICVMQLGNLLDGVVARGPVPAQFFALLQGQSYQHLVEMVKGDRAPNSWINFRALEPGMRVRIDVTRNGKPIGPDDGVELAMWGETVR